MKNTLLSFTLTLALAASAYGQYTIDVVSNPGGAFENLVNTGTANNRTNLPSDGDLTSNAYISDTISSPAIVIIVGAISMFCTRLFKVSPPSNRLGQVTKSGTLADSS